MSSRWNSNWQRYFKYSYGLQVFCLCTGNERSCALCLFCPVSVREKGGFIGQLEWWKFCWDASTAAIDDNNDHYRASLGFGLPNVAVPENKNLSRMQKDLLTWHWKLGIHMQCMQELMGVMEMREPSGAVSTMDGVIIPRIKTTTTCPILLCQYVNYLMLNHASWKLLNPR